MKKILIGFNILIALVATVALFFASFAFFSNSSSLIISNIQNYVGNGIVMISAVVILSFQLLFLNIKYLTKTK